VILALLGPALVAACLVPFRDQVASTTMVLVLVLVVVAVAAIGDRVAGTLAALASGLWFDFFLTAPYNHLAIYDREDVEAVVLLVVVGLAVTELALWGRRQEAQAGRRGGFLAGVLRVSDVLAQEDPDAASRSSVADQVAAQIVAVLRVDACRYVPGDALDPRMPVLRRNGQVWQDGQPLDVPRDGLPTTAQTYLPVRRGEQVSGYFALTAATRVARPTTEDLRIAVLLADQMRGTQGSGNDRALHPAAG
jgi:K+-sensing histidine kinase KdpD